MAHPGSDPPAPAPPAAAPPRWLWQGVLLLLTLALAGALALALALGAGWNAPHPAEPPAWRPPNPLTLTVRPPTEQAVRLVGTVNPTFALEASATPLAGAEFNGYGLVFRAEGEERYAVFAVGSDGYLAVLRVEDGAVTPALNWQSFPHVRRGREPNRLRVACAGGMCRFWVNDEVVAALEDDFGTGAGVGVWVRRFTPAPVSVRFE
jgi:hypothetical protein